MKFKRLTEEEFDWIVKCLVMFALVYFSYSVARADTIKVAVIDTGFDFNSKWDKTDFVRPKLCTNGHIDLTMKLTNITPSSYLKDNHGHGTHISGLIAKYAGDSDYCLLIAKYYDPKAKVNDNLLRTRQALEWAIKRNVDIINYSGGGTDKSNTECDIIKKALDKGIIIIAAAGNERSNLDETPYYPAMCDSRVTMVANLDVKDKHRELASTSNYNSEVVAVQGNDVRSLLPNEHTGVMSGTSQATAIMTGRLIKLLNLNNIKRSNK